MPKIMAAVSISPVGAGVSVSRFVAEAIRVLQNQDRVEYEVGPMFTTLLGEAEDVFQTIREMQEAVFRAGAVRVSTVIKMDERRDKEPSLHSKVQRVLEQLHKEEPHA